MCPTGFIEQGLSFSERDQAREKYCSDNSRPCCTSRWTTSCDYSCHEKRCREMGGNWIFDEALKNTMPYTCQMGKAYHDRSIALLDINQSMVLICR